MASAILTRSSRRPLIISAIGVLRSAVFPKAYATFGIGANLLSAAPGVYLQKACSFTEAASSKFEPIPLDDIFKGKQVVIFGVPGAYTGVCSTQHVPSYKNNIKKFIDKGIDSVLCVSINDPYTLNEWAEDIQAKDSINIYADFDGSFHRHLGLYIDLSAALLGHRAQRWSAFVDDCMVKVLNVEKDPYEVKVSGAEEMLVQLEGLL